MKNLVERVRTCAHQRVKSGDPERTKSFDNVVGVVLSGTIADHVEDVEEGVVWFIGWEVVEFLEDRLDPATGVLDCCRWGAG